MELFYSLFSHVEDRFLDVQSVLRRLMELELCSACLTDSKSGDILRTISKVSEGANTVDEIEELSELYGVLQQCTL